MTKPTPAPTDDEQPHSSQSTPHNSPEKKKSNMKKQSTSNRHTPQNCSQKSPQHQPPQHRYGKPSAASIHSQDTLTNHHNSLQSQASPYTMMQLKRQAYLQNLPEATRPKPEPAIPPSNNGNSFSTTQLKLLTTHEKRLPISHHHDDESLHDTSPTNLPVLCNTLRQPPLHYHNIHLESSQLTIYAAPIIPRHQNPTTQQNPNRQNLTKTPKKQQQQLQKTPPKKIPLNPPHLGTHINNLHFPPHPE